MRQDVTFESQGAELAAWFYTPDAPSPWPLVIMAHGFTGTRGMVTDKYAEAFAEAGLGVLLYDHRGFGDSGGEPRLQINPWIQVREYLDALDYASAHSEVDPDRMALWGDSFSGAMAISAAAVDDRVAAIVAQLPAFGREEPPVNPDESLLETMLETIRSGDVEPSGPGELVGPMPVVSEDQDWYPSALEPVSAFRWFMGYGAREGMGWVDEVTIAKPSTPVEFHRGLPASEVTCPVLFVVTPLDEMPGAKPIVARAAYEALAGPKEWVELPGGHFGLLHYPSRLFDRSAGIQARFLQERLQTEEAPLAGPAGGEADPVPPPMDDRLFR